MTSNYQTATHDASGTAQKWHILTILGHPRTPCNNTFFVKNRHRFFENSLIHIFGPGFESKLDPQNIYFLFFLKNKKCSPVLRFSPILETQPGTPLSWSEGPNFWHFLIKFCTIFRFLINFDQFSAFFWPNFDHFSTKNRPKNGVNWPFLRSQGDL